jgi:hypothetical protein
MTAPAPHIPENPWAGVPAETIVGELERLAVEARCITNRDACVLFEAADRLRVVPSPAPATFEPVDPGNTLFDVPRLRPPGSFYAVRRTDGEGIGFEDMAGWLQYGTVEECWQSAEDDGAARTEPVEYEVVLMVPARIGVRTFGPATSTGASTPRCGTLTKDGEGTGPE